MNMIKIPIIHSIKYHGLTKYTRCNIIMLDIIIQLIINI